MVRKWFFFVGASVKKNAIKIVRSVNNTVITKGDGSTFLKNDSIVVVIPIA
jgi:hypothetical protein